MEDDIGQEELPDIAGAPHDVDGISPGNKFQLCNSLISKYNLTNTCQLFVLIKQLPLLLQAY